MNVRRHAASRLIGLLALAGFIGVGGAHAASAQTKPAEEKPCASAEHRAFDFWVGDWDVKAPDGSPEGTNRIELILKDCTLHESWHGAEGGFGQSFNAYSKQDGKWHQTWVDDRGGVLLLSGGLQEGAMVLDSETLPSRREPGKMVRQRITWTRIDAGRVRQLWQQTDDAGKTWKTLFNGTYVKKS